MGEAAAAAAVFFDDEPRDGDRVGFDVLDALARLDLSHDAVEDGVGQFFGRLAIPPLEQFDEPDAQRLVFRAGALAVGVEQGEEFVESCLG